MTRSYLALIAVLLILAGCQTTPEVAELEERNALLEDRLRDAERRIKRLQRHETKLEGQVEQLEALTDVLALEKSSRAAESSELRSQVRKFVQEQIDALKAFLVHGNLLDYVGSELVARSSQEVEPLALVDMAHPVPRQGTLTGLTGYFTAPTELQLKVLRPVDDQLVVIWESALLTVTSAGENTVRLPVSVGVEPGDVVAYVFPESTQVSFDRGTGDTRYTKKELALGESVRASSLSGEKERRAYSLGVYAILE